MTTQATFAWMRAGEMGIMKFMQRGSLFFVCTLFPKDGSGCDLNFRDRIRGSMDRMLWQAWLQRQRQALAEEVIRQCQVMERMMSSLHLEVRWTMGTSGLQYSYPVMQAISCEWNV